MRFACAADDRRINFQGDFIHTLLRQHEIAAIRAGTQHGLASGRFANARGGFFRQGQQHPAFLEGFHGDLGIENHAVALDTAGVFGFGQHRFGGWRLVVLLAFQREFVPEIQEFAIGEEDTFATVLEDFFEFVEGHIHAALTLAHGEFVSGGRGSLGAGGGETRNEEEGQQYTHG